jgi:DNA-binding transcriptional LysR family regulator
VPRAARDCPAARQQIQSLGRKLGAQLFHRMPRPIELTHAGEALLEDARWILARAEQAVRNVERAGRGRARQALCRICLRGIAQSLCPGDRPHLPADLSGGFADAPRGRFARSLPRASGARGTQPVFARWLPTTSEFSSTDSSTRTCWWHCRPVTRALSNEPFILYPRRLAPTIHDAIIASCRKAGFTPTLVPEAPHVSSTIDLAAGIGISILPASMEQIHTQGRQGIRQT